MIIGPCRIVTGGPSPLVLEDGGVRVVGAHIAQVGLIGPLAASHPEETVWPARGRVLLPGFVNTHAHLARHLARGLALRTTADWERYDRALAPEDIHWAALAALVEGVRHGVTTVCDLHRSGACLDLSLSEVTGAAARLGVRVATSYAAAEEDTPRERQAALRESLSLATELGRRGEGRLRGLLGVRAATLDGLAGLLVETLEASSASLPVHVELALDATPGEPWPRDLREGVWSGLWAHAEHVPGALVDVVRERGDALTATDAGWSAHARQADLAWGTDAGVNAPPPPAAAPMPAHTPSQAAAYYQRVYVNGSRWAARHFGDGLGTIEPGAPADLVLVDYQPATELSAGTLRAHLATGIARAPVSGVMVGGEIVMDHGTLVSVDEAEVAARARECARRVWRRLG